MWQIDVKANLCYPGRKGACLRLHLTADPSGPETQSLDIIMTVWSHLRHDIIITTKFVLMYHENQNKCRVCHIV